MCTVGHTLYLYSGEGDLYLNQDYYFYDLSQAKWTIIDSLIWPPARKHACMVCDFPRFYILGGITINGYVAEVWQVDLQAMTVKLISENNKRGPKPFAFSGCSGEYIHGDLNLFVMYGETSGEYPLDGIFKYNVNTDAWTQYTEGRLMSRAAISKVNDRVIVAGGENWGLFSFKEVFSINLKTQTEEYLGELPRQTYAAASAYYKSALYIHGGGDTLGKKYRSAIPVPDFIKVEMNLNCEDCDWECSPGTSLSEDASCKACSYGTYSSDFETTCVKCPAGTASQAEGNTSLRQCLPCDEGSFSDSEGSSRCLSCPSNYVCPVGSSTYYHGSGGLPIQIKSSQPTLYYSNTSLISTVSFYFETGVALLGTAALVVYCVMKDVALFKKLDLFKKSHNHFEDEVMYIHKRPIGGLFSLWFILVALFFLAVSLTTFAVNNIEESKALVPLVAVEENYKHINGDFNLTTTFKGFIGKCDQTCKETVEVQVEKFTESCLLACQLGQDSCEVSLRCFGSEVATGSYVRYSLIEALSFASGIRVNLTSTSSIPNEFSSIEQSIEASYNHVFKGDQASQIFFEVTPSVKPTQIFTSEADQDQATGFHIAATKAPVLGSQAATLE
jgi:hypothetical protein